MRWRLCKGSNPHAQAIVVRVHSLNFFHSNASFALRSSKDSLLQAAQPGTDYLDFSDKPLRSSAASLSLRRQMLADLNPELRSGVGRQLLADGTQVLCFGASHCCLALKQTLLN